LALIQIPCVALSVLVTVALLPHLAGWLSLVLAVLALAIFVGMMMHPGTLTIDETGFTTRHPFATMHWSWNRTSNYRVVGRGVIPQVYFDAEPAEVDTRTKWLFMKLGGSLPRYGVNVNDLAATLSAYQVAASQAK